MHIHARALVSFDMIRRAGSIRAAARHLHITASAVNRQLLLLEEEVGTPLFERLSSGLQLTSAGEAFARHVITVLQDAKRLANELDALQGVRRGSVSVIAASGLMSGTLPVLLARMNREHPLVDLTVNAGSWDQSAKAVADGEVDVAIGFSVGRHAALRQAAVGRLAFGAVVSPDHPIAALPSVTFAECVRHPLILPTPALMTHAALQPLLRALKRPCKVVLNAGSIDLMKAMAAQGAGIAFQNRIGIEDDVAAGRLVCVPLRVPGKLYSEIGVYVRAERALPPAVNAFVQFAAEEIDRLRGLEP